MRGKGRYERWVPVPKTFTTLSIHSETCVESVWSRLSLCRPTHGVGPWGTALLGTLRLAQSRGHIPAKSSKQTSYLTCLVLGRQTSATYWSGFKKVSMAPKLPNLYRGCKKTQSTNQMKYLWFANVYNPAEAKSTKREQMGVREQDRCGASTVNPVLYDQDLIVWSVLVPWSLINRGQQWGRQGGTAEWLTAR